MLGGIGKGIFLRLASYAVFLLGFYLLFQAFENSNLLVGVAGGAAILAAMWLMVGFRSPSKMWTKASDRPRSMDATGRDGGSDSPDGKSE